MASTGPKAPLPIEITDYRTTSFWARVSKPDGEGGCWEWAGVLTPKGYPRMHDKRGISAHRYSYVLHTGHDPLGLDIDHLCRNRRCVNPQHLEAVTARVNILRGTCPAAVNARRTHCKRGHEYVDGSYWVRPSRPTERLCKECDTITRYERLARRRAA